MSENSFGWIKNLFYTTEDFTAIILNFINKINIFGIVKLIQAISFFQKLVQYFNTHGDTCQIWTCRDFKHHVTLPKGFQKNI